MSTNETFIFEANVIAHVRAISSRDAAAATEVEQLTLVATNPEFKAEHIGTYLLQFELGLKELKRSANTIKVSKSQVKLVLEYALGLRKGQENWSPKVCQEQFKALASKSNCLAALASNLRKDVKEQNEPSESEEKEAEQAPVDINASVLAFIGQLEKRNCSKAEIKKALQAAIKTL